MIRAYDSEIALKVGLHAAVIFQHLAWWCEHNEANEVHYHDGKYWTFASNKALRAIFPCLSRKQIETAISRLVSEGLIIKGNYNQIAYDRTTWYALTPEGKCISHIREMEFPSMGNRNPAEGEPIPVDNTVDKELSNISPIHSTSELPPQGVTVTSRAKRAAFVKPTLTDLQAYCDELNYNLDCQAFLDYYESNGWMAGKNHMKDWKATVRNWKRRDEERGKDTRAKRTESSDEHLWDGITDEQKEFYRKLARGDY